MAEQPTTTAQARCRFLTCKEMFYRDMPAEQSAHSESGFWCALTQRIQGPDDKIVGAQDCTGDRSCFESV